MDSRTPPFLPSSHPSPPPLPTPQHALEQKVEFKAAEEMVDAAGNVTEVVQKKELSKKEKKQKVTYVAR